MHTTRKDARPARGAWIGLLGLGLLVLAALTAVNLRFARQNPGGNDFLPRWVGTRALLFEGLSPYSDAVARRIQIIAYGRPAQAGEDQMRMVYPLYALPLFVPYALVDDYAWARALWMTTLEVGLVGLLALSLRLTRWRPRPWAWAGLALFALTWYHGLRAVVNGNPVVLVAVLLTAALDALARGRSGWAGVWLALATIKPHLALLPVLALGWWAWQRGDRRFWAGLLGTWAGLLALSLLVLPDWPRQNLREILAYPGYTPATTLQEALMRRWPVAGAVLGYGLSLVLAVALVRAWRAHRQARPDALLWPYSLTLVASQWLGIPTDPGNFVILFLPLVAVVDQMRRRPGYGPWAAAGLLVGLWVGLWALFVATLSPGLRGPQQHDILFVPLPAVLLAGLYGWRAAERRAPGPGGALSPEKTKPTTRGTRGRLR